MAKKTVLMCPPTYFEVSYEINDWMHVNNPVDVDLAKRQWQAVHDTYEQLSYDIHLMEPIKGLPDLVFTANGGLVIDGKVMLPRFKYPERQPETAHDEHWFATNGFSDILMPEHDFEGEGDCLLGNDIIFSGYGFRSDPGIRTELQDFFDKQVVSLKMIDPRFYHLDTCFCPLDDKTVMYYPAAFDASSRQAIEMHFPRRIEANEGDAAGFGLNAVSDGENVVVSAAAKGIHEQLQSKGFKPIGLDMTEFRKSGGAVKCCTLELRN
ncbi:MAG TPA: arginine deiminase family protein [Candidatus Saccharimonadales bacterium]|nr:arginine deiminase family protein [Candidatus Saccharimonadales bacterium]